MKFTRTIISFGCITASMTWAIPATAQTPKQEKVYQRVTAGGYVFEGVIVSSDGRLPQLVDPHWADWKGKPGIKPFQYIFRIEKVQNQGAQVVREIHLADADLMSAGVGRRDGEGIPIWFAGFSEKYQRAWFWLWQNNVDDVDSSSSIFNLICWDADNPQIAPLVDDIDTAIDRGNPPIPARYRQPDSHLSPSGKYLAVLVDDSSGAYSLVNHIELFPLEGASYSLKDRQGQEVGRMSHAKHTVITDFHWNPGDQLECTVRELPKVGIIESTDLEAIRDANTPVPGSLVNKIYVYPDTLLPPQPANLKELEAHRKRMDELIQ